MMKITGLSHLFKWENLHNWWLTKYFFAPLYIRGTAQVGTFVDKVREVGPIWFGRVQRRDAGYDGRRVLRMERPGRRRRGRPKGRDMDVVMEDM